MILMILEVFSNLNNSMKCCFLVDTYRYRKGKSRDLAKKGASIRLKDLWFFQV